MSLSNKHSITNVSLRTITLLAILISVGVFSSCKKENKDTIETPWGTELNVNGNEQQTTDSTSQSRNGAALSLDELKENGEIIMLTMSGPETYYDYHGHGMGAYYLMTERLAEEIGVMVRVDVCHSEEEMIQRLKDGEGDVIAYPLDVNDKENDDLEKVGAWYITKDNKDLEKVISEWYKPDMLTAVEKEEQQILSAPTITRHVYPKMISAERGEVSTYDGYFKRYAPMAQMDWTMLAAQCYQEACFDPKAHSWAGACGLMQIMPKTADHLGLARSQMYEAEPSIAAGARYMSELQGLFRDIPNREERLRFALAAYNGGYGHVRDAMALAKKYGSDPQRWSDVKRFIVGLSQPQFYRDPVVRYGYIRGQETSNYVDYIVARQQQYRQALATGKTVISNIKIAPTTIPNISTDRGEVRTDPHSSPLEGIPHRAAKKNKYR